MSKRHLFGCGGLFAAVVIALSGCGVSASFRLGVESAAEKAIDAAVDGIKDAVEGGKVDEAAAKAKDKVRETIKENDDG